MTPELWLRRYESAATRVSFAVGKFRSFRFSWSAVMVCLSPQ